MNTEDFSKHPVLDEQKRHFDKQAKLLAALASQIKEQADIAAKAEDYAADMKNDAALREARYKIVNVNGFSLFAYFKQLSTLQRKLNIPPITEAPAASMNLQARVMAAITLHFINTLIAQLMLLVSESEAPHTPDESAEIIALCWGYDAPTLAIKPINKVYLA